MLFGRVGLGGLFDLHRRLTTVQRTELPLEDVNDAIERVLDGSAPAPRLVFDMSKTNGRGAARAYAAAAADA